MPWNFPFWQVFRFAAPALMAGNAGLLKHAPNVTRCALAIEEVFRQAGFPEGLFRTVILQNEAVAGVIADPRVRAATLTGSDRAGSQVAAQAGTHLQKMVLELCRGRTLPLPWGSRPGPTARPPRPAPPLTNGPSR